MPRCTIRARKQMTLAALISYLRQHSDKDDMPIYAGVLGEQARPVFGIQVSRLSDGSHQCMLILQDWITPCQPEQ